MPSELANRQCEKIVNFRLQVACGPFDIIGPILMSFLKYVRYTKRKTMIQRNKSTQITAPKTFTSIKSPLSMVLESSSSVLLLLLYQSFASQRFSYRRFPIQLQLAPSQLAPGSLTDSTIQLLVPFTQTPLGPPWVSPPRVSTTPLSFPRCRRVCLRVPSFSHALYSPTRPLRPLILPLSGL